MEKRQQTRHNIANLLVLGQNRDSDFEDGLSVSKAELLQ